MSGWGGTGGGSAGSAPDKRRPDAHLTAASERTSWTAVDLMAHDFDSEPPVLDAYVVGGYAKVWCDWCEVWHHHGAEDGLRRPHCACRKSPYRDSGYVLRITDAKPPRKRQRPGSACVQSGNCENCPAMRHPIPSPKGPKMSTVLHKDGDQFAIVTEAEDEVAFVAEFSDALSHLIEENAHDGDWRFQLQRWLPLAFEVTCKYRGYKALVTERRTIISGQLDPNAALVAAGRVAEGVSAVAVPEE